MIGKVAVAKTVRILTSDDNSAQKHFLEPLKARGGCYEHLDVFKELNEIQKTKEEFKRIPKSLRDVKIQEVSSLPIQLLIVDLPKQEGFTEKRYGCLVFMVGSQSLAGTISGEEAGFYTELSDMVDVFKKLAESLIAAPPRSARA